MADPQKRHAEMKCKNFIYLVNSICILKMFKDLITSDFVEILNFPSSSLVAQMKERNATVQIINKTRWININHLKESSRLTFNCAIQPCHSCQIINSLCVKVHKISFNIPLYCTILLWFRVHFNRFYYVSTFNVTVLFCVL